LIEIIEYGLGEGLLRYLGRDEVVRSVEMHGPDFFFLLNRHWSIVGRNREYVIIRNSDGQRLSIRMKYLVECLRKPEYYNMKPKSTIQDLRPSNKRRSRGRLEEVHRVRRARECPQ